MFHIASEVMIFIFSLSNGCYGGLENQYNMRRAFHTLSNTRLYTEANKRYDEICQAISKIEKEIKKYPEGKIHVVNNKNRVQFYLRTSSKDKSGIYLSKQQKDTIGLFLQKKYDEDALKLLCKEKDNLESFLKKYAQINYKIQELYSKSTKEVQDYIKPIDMSDSDYAMEWQKEFYRKKKILPDVPVFITNQGEHVRSKSELIIANRLACLRIPYKYECPLTLSGGKIIYPDFTIWDINNRREVYWEHRGMMDSPDYAVHSVQRLKEYCQNGIFLGKNLIITEETSSVPLDTRYIDDIIKCYFLNRET